MAPGPLADPADALAGDETDPLALSRSAALPADILDFLCVFALDSRAIDCFAAGAVDAAEADALAAADGTPWSDFGAGRAA